MAELRISADTDECRAQTAADELAVTVTLKTKAERDAGSVPALLDEISALVMLCTAVCTAPLSCASAHLARMDDATRYAAERAGGWGYGQVRVSLNCFVHACSELRVAIGFARSFH